MLSNPIVRSGIRSINRKFTDMPEPPGWTQPYFGLADARLYVSES
jgi:hypothetical protein